MRSAGAQSIEVPVAVSALAKQLCHPDNNVVAAAGAALREIASGGELCRRRALRSFV